MKKLASMFFAFALVCTTVQAIDLNVRILTSDGMSSADVGPGDTVNYQVLGILSDDLNEGLALVGFDLTFDGGDLTQADTPTGTATCENPMPIFVRPEGITNPVGYGGTVINGVLVQCGGGQNTIRNTIGNADFPIGTPLLGIAQPAVCGEAVLLTGSLTAPMTEGPYLLSIPVSSGFANIINEEETLGNVFLATSSANVVVMANLPINVTSAACGIVDASPPNCAIDAGYPSDPNNASSLLGLTSINVVVDTGCDAGSVAPGDFNVTVTSGVVPSILSVTPDEGFITLDLNGPIPAGAWTCFELGSSQTCIGFLPGDALSDGTSTALDIDGLIGNLNNEITLDLWQCDINRSGTCTSADILGGIDLLNGGGEFTAWMGATLGACPSIAP